MGAVAIRPLGKLPEDEGAIALSDPLAHVLRSQAHDHGYTILVFNPTRMSWAWHKPDQAVGPDGTVFVSRHVG